MDLTKVSANQLESFLMFANLYAAHTTTKEGAIDAMATMEELTAFKNEVINQ